MTKGGFAEAFIKVLAGLCVTGGLAWGTYLQGRIDTQGTIDTEHTKKIAVLETNYENIEKSLERIERKLDASPSAKLGGSK